MRKYWIKLHMELLDDPKIRKFPDWLFRRFILILLAAGEYGKDGLLQPVDDLAWRLRLSEDQIDETLRALDEVGVVHMDENNQWWITNYAKFQAPDSDAERAKRYRENKKTSRTVTDDSDSISSSESISLKNNGRFSKVDTSIAVSDFGDNMARDALKLYTQVTNQIQPPSGQIDKAIQDLSTILDHYKAIDVAVPDGKRVFARWCSTLRKDGRPYSATNTDWLGWWLDEIAPRPEKQELSVIERVFGVGGIK